MTQPLRIRVAQYTERLEAAGVDSPRLSAEVLLAHAMGISRAELLKKLLLEPEAPLPHPVALHAESCIARREAGEPVAYITGVKEFYGRDFAVTPATLIPRPDTETLVDAALTFARHCPPSFHHTFLDCGTGSGAIAVTLALELPCWRGMAVDSSPDALAIARRNAETLNAATLTYTCCDYCGPDLPAGPYGLVVANPPYVSEDEYQGLSPEVSRFEPKSALVPAVHGPSAQAPSALAPPVAGATGLEHLMAILTMAERLLVPGGLLLMEMGSTQGDALLDAARTVPAWTDCYIIPDLAGLPRVFHALRG